MYVSKSRPGWSSVGVAALAATVAAGGAAWAATASSSATAQIHGCASARTGALRVIVPGRKGLAGKCSRHERALSWNKQGPMGARGSTGLAGPAGPGAVEYPFSLGVGQSKTLGAAGPFSLSATCTTSGTETATQLLETNSATVNFNETTFSPEEAPPADISMTSASEPAEAVPAELDVVASSTGAQRQTERMLTPPSAELGQLNDMLYVSSGFCSGSVIWIPASSG